MASVIQLHAKYIGKRVLWHAGKSASVEAVVRDMKANNFGNAPLLLIEPVAGRGTEWVRENVGEPFGVGRCTWSR
jgi:hypothetical protein